MLSGNVHAVEFGEDFPSLDDIFGPREVGHAVHCRGCLEDDALPERASWVALLAWNDAESRWRLTVFQPRRLTPGGARTGFLDGDTYQGKETVELRCPVCRTNLGPYSPRGLGKARRAR